MHRSIAVAAAAAVLLSPAAAIAIEGRSAGARTLSLPIERRSIPDPVAHDRARLRKRQGTVEQTLDNDHTLYYANITLGTPAQNLRMHIDTGSSDLWVNVASSSFCQQGYCTGGTYDSDASSTYNFVNDVFNISYVDGSAAVGDYVSDTLGFGGHNLEDFQFGIGTESSSEQGVLGIGYVTNEVQHGRAGLDTYPNLPEALVNAGLIASNAYSIWLNDLDASTGEILFGGVNTGKYMGDLQTVPVIPQSGDDGYYSLMVAMTGISVGGISLDNAASLPTAVLLDTGATLTYLPDDIVQEIYVQIQAVYSSDVGAAYVECSREMSGTMLDFDIQGITISVPYDELFLDAGTNNFGDPLRFESGELACLFGIAPAGNVGISVLGDTFLRSAYVVYDLANNEISLAQTVFNSTTDDIREIGTGSNSVPNAAMVASPVTDVVADTSGSTILGTTGGTTSNLPDGAAMNLAVPSALLGAVAAIMAFLL